MVTAIIKMMSLLHSTWCHCYTLHGVRITPFEGTLLMSFRHSHLVCQNIEVQECITSVNHYGIFCVCMYMYNLLA